MAAPAFADEQIHEPEITTVTKTDYVSSPCLKGLVDDLLPNNPKGLTTGIPIVFVHAPKSVAGQPVEQSITSDSYTQIQAHTSYATVSPQKAETHVVAACETIISTYTTRIVQTVRCSSNVCQTSTITSLVPTVYTSTGLTTFATTSAGSTGAGSTASRSSSAQSNGNGNSGGNNSASVAAGAASLSTTSVEIAVTTTSTVFTATTELSSTYEPSATLEPITSRSAPVTSQSVVSESQSVTIDVSTITNDVTISTSAAQTTTTTTTTPSSESSEAEWSSSAAAGAASFPSSEATTVLSTVVLTSSSLVPYTNSSTYYSTTLSTLTTVIVSTESGGDSDFVEESSFESHSETASESSSAEPISSESTTTSAEATSAEPSESAESEEPTETAEPEICYSGDLFAPISNAAPPSVFPRDQLPLAIPAGVNNKGVPIQTNKYYANLFLGTQDMMVYTYPYAVYWSKRSYYGFAVQHTDPAQRVFGSQYTNNQGVASYYFNPTNNGEIIFSATTFGQDSVHMGVTDMTEMAVKVTLSSTANDEINNVEIPLVQGMGFATAIYNGNMVLKLNSLYSFKALVLEDSDALPSNVLKYRVTLYNDVQWLVYITLPSEDSDFELSSPDATVIQASKSIDGLIVQVAIAPEGGDGDQYYDAAAGMYATDASLQGSVICSSSASYQFVYSTSGTSTSGNPLIFALPHHLETITGAGATGIKVSSQTKGEMTGFLTKTLSFTESIDKNIHFLPYIEGSPELSYTVEQLALLATSANDELSVDIASTVKNMNSNYFSGKVIDKYAQILLVVDEIIRDEAVTNSTLAQMKDAFETFLNNQQYYPLMYDTKFGGVTSTAAQNGDDGADYGSAYYNDHHFHYGYFVHAAAVVGKIDKKLGGTWAQDNKDWVESLIRDVANPSRSDVYFPVSRMFSWYDGHSWAAGVYPSNDGKNQESSSEDIHFAYGMKLWGNVVEDYAMEARGGLMLSIMKRAFNLYFYYKSDNPVQPAEILPNKVSGIFFENKVDYTTYFGSPDQHPEYVHGIHMLPITAASSSVRIPSYVQEEWDEQISTFIDNVNSGWTGILRLNQALINPQEAYEFFSSSNWSNNYLDNGQSRTWSLAFSGAFS
ncbi:uncharacterized protein LODBEIA_P28370 [Lodderomyces beijingensis]|uniref:glucan endo-1,3-beta-D-glucosidase n=1 Tax=Lodderomyces beijingensis TaxID=1775926 RepID=A0ABP0ZLV1_9ASCO